MNAIVIISCLIAGATLGILVMACMIAAGRADDRIEQWADREAAQRAEYRELRERAR